MILCQSDNPLLPPCKFDFSKLEINKIKQKQTIGRLKLFSWELPHKSLIHDSFIYKKKNIIYIIFKSFYLIYCAEISFSPFRPFFLKKIPCLLFCVISGRWVMGIQVMKVTPHVVFNCCTEPIPGADPQLIIWRGESNEAILLIFAINVPSSGAVSWCRGPRGGLFILGVQRLA